MKLEDIELKLSRQERFDLFVAVCFWINEKPVLPPSEHGAHIIESCRERMRELRDRLQDSL